MGDTPQKYLIGSYPEYGPAGIQDINKWNEIQIGVK